MYPTVSNLSLQSKNADIVSSKSEIISFALKRNKMTIYGWTLIDSDS